MKKKLLITLGCSYTEGVGCYEPSLLDVNGKPIKDAGQVYQMSLDRFHNFGWPVLLQKKLRYDCLWNLGHGGASNSENVKRWFEIFSEERISDEYEVLVVWMLTFSGRISFYRGGQIDSILPADAGNMDEKSVLYESYVNFLQTINRNVEKDMVLETYFYVNIIKTICELLNYNFLYIAGDTEGKYLDNLLKSSNSLNFAYTALYPKYDSILQMNPSDYEKNTAFCKHPNEKGYELIAERFFNIISYEHKHLINENIPATYEMRYLGDPKKW